MERSRSLLRRRKNKALLRRCSLTSRRTMRNLSGMADGMAVAADGGGDIGVAGAAAVAGGDAIGGAAWSEYVPGKCDLGRSKERPNTLEHDFIQPSFLIVN